MRANRRDANDQDLTRLARQCGAVVLKMKPGQGFDLLVCHRGRVLILEIKDGKKPPSARKLTDQEQEVKSLCESRGVSYHVVSTEAELLKLLQV